MMNESVLEPYRDDGFSPWSLERIYLWISFDPENSPNSKGEQFNVAQMKEGLKWLDFKGVTLDASGFNPDDLLGWIKNVYQYTQQSPKIDSSVSLQPLLKLFRRTRKGLYKFKPSSALVETPGQSITLRDIYQLYSSREVLPIITYLHNQQPRGDNKYVDADSAKREIVFFIYKFFIEKLAARCNNGQPYLKSEITSSNQPLQQTIFNNSDLFEPWRALIIFCQTNYWDDVDFPLLLKPESKQDDWFETQSLANQFFNIQGLNDKLYWLWRYAEPDPMNGNHFTYEYMHPGYLTRANMIATYAVGAAFVKFDPSLLLCLSPEFTSIVEEFWEDYGEAITLLQELYEAYQSWNENVLAAPLGGFKIESNRNLAATQVCNRLATRLVDETTFDRLRGKLVDLADKAVVEGVPLKLLIENLNLVANARAKYSEIHPFGGIANDPKYLLARHPMMVSSVWWFDYFRIWWDAVCKTTLNTRLRELIEEQMPSNLKELDSSANQVLIDSLRQVAISGPKAASQARHLIRHAKLPRDSRRLLLEKFQAIIADESALSQLTYLGKAVQLGTMGQAIADLELMNLIDRWDR